MPAVVNYEQCRSVLARVSIDVRNNLGDESVQRQMAFFRRDWVLTLLLEVKQFGQEMKKFSTLYFETFVPFLPIYANSFDYVIAIKVGSFQRLGRLASGIHTSGTDQRDWKRGKGAYVAVLVKSQLSFQSFSSVHSATKRLDVAFLAQVKQGSGRLTNWSLGLSHKAL